MAPALTGERRRLLPSVWLRYRLQWRHAVSERELCCLELQHLAHQGLCRWVHFFRVCAGGCTFSRVCAGGCTLSGSVQVVALFPGSVQVGALSVCTVHSAAGRCSSCQGAAEQHPLTMRCARELLLVHESPWEWLWGEPFLEWVCPMRQDNFPSFYQSQRSRS